jgi:K+-transporting ATPase ATPase A chain
MTFNGWLQIVLFAVLVVLLTKPFGGYMTRVFTGERTLLRPVLRPIEVGIYRICGVREDQEQHWVDYAVAMLAFRACCRSIRSDRARSHPIQRSTPRSAS